ncbi:alpha/beta fold hydrolase [Jannaschia ovalis]|uniref:Alpha/beta fold hydrolase n=1 Tax=Jannaschia ovalis TaxID=3038773 RepID=A0ABY8LHR9_9RHOB|nr:alpha/beta fold hydrolase [Jannaschia sp. GRR-S6-38]WGH79739.1 alpha/beta fold hydrolase [Jannaschia sp. GRR-S6-38]
MWTLDETYETSAGTVRAGRAGEGSPLLLAHGWPWSSFAWHRVIPALAARHRVHWYDMPGFGGSQMDGPRPAALDVQGEILGEMLDHLGLAAPRIVAHDFGGAVALRAHLLHGRDYARLVLMNVVAMRPWGSEFFDHVGRHVAAFAGLPAHIHAAVVDAYIGGALVRDLLEDDRAGLVRPWLDERGKAAFYAQFALADERFTAEIEPDFDKLRCSSAVLWGSEDPWIPIDRGAALADRMGVPLRRLEGLGHLPQLEDPGRVSEALLDALEAAA